MLPHSNLGRILVGFDGSAPAARAVQVALELANEIGSRVFIVSVLPSLSHVETDEERAEESAQEHDLLRQRLEPYIADASAQAVTFLDLMYDGDPADSLSSYARQNNFDLLVVGRHGEDHVSRRGIGHGLNILLHRMPCPLLVV